MKMKTTIIALILTFCLVGVGHGEETKTELSWQNLSTGSGWVFAQAHINEQRLVYLQGQIDKLKAEVEELRKMVERSASKYPSTSWNAEGKRWE